MKWRKHKRYNWIALMINEREFSIGVEVGAATGITTQFLLKHCPSLQSLTVVDLWEPVKGSHAWDREDMESLFRSKFEGQRKLTILKGCSWEMADHIRDQSVDFVFIDAAHDYDSVIKDIKAWYPKVIDGGMLCGHDLHFPDVQRAAKESFGKDLRAAGVDNMWFTIV